MKRHLSRITAICNDYKPRAAMIETNSFGQHYYELLSDENPHIDWLRFTASANSNLRILEAMAMRMECKTLVYPDRDEILRELRGLEEDPLTGKIAAAESFNDGDEESELHDDIPRSIALAVHCYQQAPPDNPLAAALSKMMINKQNEQQ